MDLSLVQEVQETSMVVKTLFQEKKNELAKRYLQPILEALQLMLISSIALFTAGLLYQWWSLSFQEDHPLNISVAVSTISSLLVLASLVLIVFSLFHGLASPASPFHKVASTFFRFRPGKLDLQAEVYGRKDSLSGTKGGHSSARFLSLSSKISDPVLLKAIAPMLKDQFLGQVDVLSPRENRAQAIYYGGAPPPRIGMQSKCEACCCSTRRSSH